MIDQRAGAGVELFCEPFDVSEATGADYTDAKRESVRDGVERAIAWMRSTGLSKWSHPDVCEAVFEAPVGYELEQYWVGNRETVVYYRREDADDRSRLAGAGEPDAYTLETCPYLYIHVWNGSGNTTVALAPWLRAHGPGSKYPEIREIAETPDGCGLEIAVTVARQWAREHVDATDEGDAPAYGQVDLARWSA